MPDNRNSETIWWLHPGVAFAFITGGVALAAYAIPESLYFQYWRTPRYFGALPLQFAWLAIAAFVFGTWVGNVRPMPLSVQRWDTDWRDQIPWTAAIALFRISFYLCIAGYTIWAASAIHRGVNLHLLVQVFTGQKGALDDLKTNYLTTIAGATSLNNFDVAIIVLGFLIGSARGWTLVRRKCWIVFLLAALRAFLNSERLAVIELVVPFTLLYFQLVYLSSERAKARLGTAVRLFPLIGPAALFCVFTATEYFRSWASYFSGQGANLFEFAALRLLGYYVTALNNGAYLMDRVNYPLGAPFFTFDFLWRFPVLSDVVKEMFSSVRFDAGTYAKLLQSGANPEFTNADGILLPILDYGLAGGLLYWLLAGLVCGVLYRLFTRKHPVGLCLYPVVFIGIIETPRILFWGAGRIFPTWCLLFASCIIFVTSRRKPALTGEPGFPALRSSV